MQELSFGFSPCPNDTFAFHAVVHELVGSDLRVRPSLRDIEELNRAARTGELELSKLSVGALAALGDGYRPLRAGAALGHGVGPLVVAREAASLRDAAAGRIAVPGLDTTAFLLLRLAAPALGEVVELRYDRILDAVAGGEVDAGLIIHESRFTYMDHGLVRVADLGEWWEGETGLPVPLAVIGARADLDPELVELAERSLRASVEHAFAQPEASRAYVRAHSQELSDAVCDQHIALYVNEFSIDLGDAGMRAVEALTARTGAARP
jgi:1,4-dihydroxy-6-naphthoate synthase